VQQREGSLWRDFEHYTVPRTIAVKLSPFGGRWQFTPR
jgi:hypothetical protein